MKTQYNIRNFFQRSLHEMRWDGRRLAGCLVLLFLAVSFGAAQMENERCFKCHAESWIARMQPKALASMVSIPEGTTPIIRDQADIPGLRILREDYSASVHAGLDCQTCHPSIEKLPHTQKVAALSCAECHSDAMSEIQLGKHAAAPRDGRERPSCATCHGSAHTMLSITGSHSFDEAVAMVETCSECHHEINALNAEKVDSYRDSIHGKALYDMGLGVAPTCSDCHGNHQMLPVSDPASPMHPTNVADTCGGCHEGVAREYESSIHGRMMGEGHEEAATCTSCHKGHGMHKVGKPFLLEVAQECAHCHLDLGESYIRSFHGKATQLGDTRSAVCSSCHGSHGILPKDDPKSRVHEDNLVETCRECHPGSNENFVQYIAHVDYFDREANPIVFYTFWVMTTLLCSVLLVFIPHSALWFQRTLMERIRHPKGHIGRAEKDRMIKRFDPIHRFTHLLIVISFMGLVLTGFPLKYSYTEWALYLSSFFGGIATMGLLHRFFAIVTFAYAGLHFAFLAYFFAFKCPRPRWKYLLGPESMILTWRDVKDFFAMMRWFLWLGPRPKLDRWTYFEKFDYFGEIWGVFLIGGTGLILWFPTLFTRWLPGWVLNCAMVIHSIEALLAASVIFLVHFFNTHIRPEKFPIDMVMLTGQMSETEMKEERPAEYERLVQEGRLEDRVVPAADLKVRIAGAIFGIAAFLTGIGLIILAIFTELSQFFV